MEDSKECAHCGLDIVPVENKSDFCSVECQKAEALFVQSLILVDPRWAESGCDCPMY